MTIPNRAKIEALLDAGHVVRGLTIDQCGDLARAYLDATAALQRREDEVTRLRDALGPCIYMLDSLKAESGRQVEYGEEDAFRIGEWFDGEDFAAIERARAALKGASHD